MNLGRRSLAELRTSRRHAPLRHLLPYHTSPLLHPSPPLRLRQFRTVLLATLSLGIDWLCNCSEYQLPPFAAGPHWGLAKSAHLPVLQHVGREHEPQQCSSGIRLELRAANPHIRQSALDARRTANRPPSYANNKTRHDRNQLCRGVR